MTKRKMLSAINSFFELLGIGAPVVIVGKILHSEVCLMKKFQMTYGDHELPRSVVGVGLTRVILHGFSDASKLAVSVAVYAVTTHITTPVQQRLVVAKPRIALKDQSIPRIELVAAHTMSRLMHHVVQQIHDTNVGFMVKALNLAQW